MDKKICLQARSGEDSTQSNPRFVVIASLEFSRRLHLHIRIASEANCSFGRPLQFCNTGISGHGVASSNEQFVWPLCRYSDFTRKAARRFNKGKRRLI